MVTPYESIYCYEDMLSIGDTTIFDDRDHWCSEIFSIASTVQEGA